MIWQGGSGTYGPPYTEQTIIMLTELCHSSIFSLVRRIKFMVKTKKVGKNKIGSAKTAMCTDKSSLSFEEEY